MYYINPTGPYHGNPMGQPFPGCTLDGNTVTALAVDQEALDAYKAEHPDAPEPEPTATVEERMDALEAAIERGLNL